MITPTKNLLNYVYLYFKAYRVLVIKVILSLVIAGGLQLILPFIAQEIVDKGINFKDVSFIALILVAQLFVLIGKVTMEFIRNRILVYLSNYIFRSISNRLIEKLIKLPTSAIEGMRSGEILQNIHDSQRIEEYISGDIPKFLLSVSSIIVLTGVLAYYNPIIFLVFILGSIVFGLWINYFMKKRGALDNRLFEENSNSQNKILELVNGIEDIKLYNLRKTFMEKWSNHQVKQLEISVDWINLHQTQNAGAIIINEVKNLIIVFIVSKLVIQEQITIGAMLSISYILGQTSWPLLEFISFTQKQQNASLSLNRLNTLYELENEDSSATKKHLRENGPIIIKDLSYEYLNNLQRKVIDSINLYIEKGKTTAIVGTSGSGKTTLLKLILKLYSYDNGSIKIGKVDLKDVNSELWREKCSAVMQNGYTFNDSVLNNITCSDKKLNKSKLETAIKVANIDFIETLPFGINTFIGQGGYGLSRGQTQRIHIARAIYKDADYLFFDELTHSLDNHTERIVMQNLKLHLLGKTIVVIAHRLNTIVDADKIIFLEGGRIVEEGTHSQLVSLDGKYKLLLENQLLKNN